MASMGHCRNQIGGKCITKINEKIIKEIQKACEDLDEYAENLDDTTRCSIHLDNILEIIETFNSEKENIK